jgi:nucleotide-binding universal stress UspA family protein
MVTFASILCPVDFSEESRNALRWAVAMAVRFQGRVTVLTVVEPLLAHAAETRFGVDLPKETAATLREFVTATLPKAAWVPRVEIAVRVGNAPAMILETTDGGGVDLVVMGTHGLGGVKKLLLGSTTERVLRQTRVPVLGVPGGATAAGLDDSGPRFTLNAIVAASDFSAPARAAVELAGGLARDLAAALVVIHAVAPVFVPVEWQAYVEVAHEQRATETRERLEKWLQDIAPGLPAETVVTVDRPAELIASVAAEKRAGVIVMGLSGERGAFASRPGSIAYRVLSAARVPVLVVPAG